MLRSPLLRRTLTEALTAARPITSQTIIHPCIPVRAIHQSRSFSPFLKPATGGRLKRVLGVETSCDDTALAILDTDGRVLSHASASQWHLFDEFAGIRPMSAALAHDEMIDKVFSEVLSKASLKVEDLDGVAVTAGPGLAPCLEVGLRWSSELASKHQFPMVGVHHMQAHAMVAQMDHPQLRYPFLSLLISGGHTELWLVRSQNEIDILSETPDDAIGEAYDKVARMLGIERMENESPGASIERLAGRAPLTNNITQPFFAPLQHDYYEFSFAGIKSAVQREVLQRRVDRLPVDSPLYSSDVSSTIPRLYRNPDGRINNITISTLVKEMRAQHGLSKQAALDPQHTANTLLAHLPPLDLSDQIELSAAFQHAVCEQLISRTSLALTYCRRLQAKGILSEVNQIVLGGGVACNLTISSSLTSYFKRQLTVLTPRKLYCMDNGIMIAWMGMKILKQGHRDMNELRFHPRWPIGRKIDMRLADMEAKMEDEENKKKRSNGKS